MTVPASTARVRYEGNGATVDFSTSFLFQDNDHVKVIFTDTDGAETTWTENTHYTLVGADTGSAGTVSVKTTPTDYTPQDDEFITIIRNMPFTQELAGAALTTYSAAELEDEFDYLVMCMTQLNEAVSRCIQSSEGGAGGEPDLTAWSPILAVVADSTRRVFQIADWTGGEGTKPDTGDYIGSGGLVADIANGVDIRGPAGASGAGTGDMLGANNLSDVANAATAFATIKQGSTDTYAGVIEIATDAEALLESDATRALCPANLAALGGTETFAGLLELATTAEATAGTDTARAVTPAGLAAALSASGEFPSTTAMIFVQTSAPTGWTKSATHNDKALRVVTGTASSGGSVAFSTLFARTAVDSHTLTTTEMPVHTHTITGNATAVLVAGSATGSTGSGSYEINSSPTWTAANAGSGGGHVHNIDMRVNYVDVIIATKD